MLYRIAKPLATIALKTNFRRIYFSNAQVIPKNKPVILAVNHPSAFLEPCLLACLLPQPLHFLVRGNLFSSAPARWALNALQMIPIYRKSDGGFGDVKQNFSTFDLCYEKLAANKTIMILAEGNTIQEKRLRPIQKGTARIAFGALANDENLDLKIVPVGVNFSYADRFRSHVMFEFGEPISVQKYKQDVKENKNKAIRSLTSEIENRLKKRLVIIDEKEDEDLVEKLLIMRRSDFEEPFFPVVSRHNHRLRAEQNIADTISKMAEKEKSVLAEKVNDYFEKMEANGLEDWAIAQKDFRKNAGILTIIFGFLPAVIGYLGNYIPVLIPQLIAYKFVKYLEFKAPIKIAVAIGSFPFYYLCLLTFSILSGNSMLLFFIFLLPFFGYFSLIYREYFKKWQLIRTLKGLAPEDLQNLKTSRENILQFFDRD